MKCIRCGHDSKYKDRQDGRCPQCKAEFAFEPRARDPLTDMFFRRAIGAVSGEGGLRWGVENLYYEVCRRKRGFVSPLWLVLCLLLLAACLLGLGLALKPEPFQIFFVQGGISAFAALICAYTRFGSAYVGMDRSTFDRLWKRWVQAHGKPIGVIERAPEQPELEHLEVDIGDYSFDRAVICDRARTVDLLVANNFHFENNCAILSIDGYPKRPFAVIKTMLNRNPRLLVFVLHDSTPEGCRVAYRLVTDPAWFGESGLRVIDLGLGPRHAKPFHGLFLHASSGKVDATGGITAEEAEWLTRFRLELAAVRPEQVLKRLFAGLQAHANDDPRTGDSHGAVTNCLAFDAAGYGGCNGDGHGDGSGGADAFG